MENVAKKNDLLEVLGEKNDFFNEILTDDALAFVLEVLKLAVIYMLLI